MKKLILLLATVGMLLHTQLAIAGGAIAPTEDFYLTPGTYSSWPDEEEMPGGIIVYHIDSQGDYYFSGTLPCNAIFVVNADKVTIHLENFSMPYGGALDSRYPDGFQIYGSSVELILVGESTITSEWGTPVNVKSTGSLTISSENDGSLTLTSNHSALQSDGTTTIEGGTVIANGSGSNPGISGSGDLVVNGGTLIATGGTSGAGIVADSVTITDGTVVAKGKGSKAGISSNSIIINGGAVLANSVSGSAMSIAPSNSFGNAVYPVTLPDAAAASLSSGNTYTYTVTKSSGNSYSYSGSGLDDTDDLYFYLPNGTYIVTGSDAAAGRQYGGTVSGAAVTFDVISEPSSSVSGAAWSEPIVFDTLNIASGQTLYLKPTDAITYSTKWAPGYDRKITVFAKENAASISSAGDTCTILDTAGEEEGTCVWDYTRVDPNVLPRSSTYTLYYSITDRETGTEFTPSGGYSSVVTVSILPEPTALLGLLFLSVLTFRKR